MARLVRRGQFTGNVSLTSGWVWCFTLSCPLDKPKCLVRSLDCWGLMVWRWGSQQATVLNKGKGCKCFCLLLQTCC